MRGNQSRCQLTAELAQQGHGDQRRMHQRFRQGHVATLLGQQHEVQLAHAQAAEFLRHGDTRQAQLGQLLPQGAVAPVPGFPSRRGCAPA